MKRSHWLPLMAVAGVAFLASSLFSVAQAQSGPSLYNPDLSSGDLRKPSTPYAPAPRIPKTGKQADLLASTDFYQFVTSGRERASNPDIAVGPDDIIVVAGQNRIMRIPNPNATNSNLPYTAPPYNAAPTGGVLGVPSPLTNLNALRAGVATSEVFIDTWVGTAVLNNICPGQFNPQTCLIQYPTVRYDQLHGHFLVAFAITDTGVRGPDQIVTQGRASTWVLIVSKYASFVKSDGTLGSSGAPPGTSRIFTLPIPAPDSPGGGTNTGGLNADWFIYYGNRDSAGAGGFLNINMYTTHPTAAPLSAPGRYSASFPESNCNAPVGLQPPLSGTKIDGPVNGAATAGEETVCLFPTEVRLGIDNDSIILSSPVYNVNQIVPNANTINFTTGRYAGNRVRVLSKYAIYNVATLANGTWFLPGAYVAPVPYSGVVGLGLIVTPPTQTAFDMFRNADLPAFCTVFDLATDTCTTPAAGFRPRQYTLGLEVSLTGTGIDTPRPPAAPQTLSALRPLYYEPAHLRGRAMASYSNYPFGGLTHLVGSYSNGTTAGGGNLWVQPITYRADYRPALDAGFQSGVAHGVDGILIDGPRLQYVPDSVINPYQVPQSVTCSTTPCSGGAQNDPQNLLYVGDSRPQRVVHREGHLYDARVGRPTSNLYGTSIVTPGAANANTANATLSSTVYYDVVQMIYTSAVPALPPVGSPAVFTLPLPNPSLTFYSFWQNGHFYAPMFDVTANVIQQGAASPSWLLPYFEKLFVGTTSPRFFYPAVSSQGNIWPSLYDVRTGVDKYDRFEWYRDPRTGRVVNPSTIVPNIGPAGVQESNTTNLLTTRGGAATDPNLGGLWVYGAFSDFRIAGGVGQWATHAAYYDMSFANADPYGTNANFFSDVCPVGAGNTTCLEDPFFVYIQTARQIGLTAYLIGPTGAQLGSGTPGVPAHGTNGAAVAFQSARLVTRMEMAAFVVYSQMDLAAVADYLAKTASGSAAVNTFADVFVGRTGTDAGGNAVTISQAQRDAVEVLARRGYTRGCLLVTDGASAFCPFDYVTRGQMAVFVVRAKENNVHPTVISGCPTVGTGGSTTSPFLCVSNNGDNFWVFQTGLAYFTDVPVSHPFYGYIQKFRELRITNGISPTLYGPDQPMSRGQMATFIVRGFHF